MSNGRIVTDAPGYDEISIDEMVDAVDPRDDREEVYPARNIGERSFFEYGPYDWIEGDEGDL